MSEEPDRLPFLQVLGSVIASFLGVQSDARRHRDFTRGRPRDFILVGVLLTAVFIALVYGAVRLAMGLAGG